ncbi:hypothetical protein Cob_v000182 [Colletotrichum orbiculare MAFF 240422]|uniref:Uncharacterized protein n=1 Tax=Colletotrichum orbiculare (strain 104-T / ATCC 96160 / CBS 514.97 / LARS 414 / MAFF 240422) TaxID=1213857 RepID=A0A484G8F8_COLOR|nr:hypothetical protein Cob_v000182 [Colletotrichum orbiculare MAFF 240422]
MAFDLPSFGHFAQKAVVKRVVAVTEREKEQLPLFSPVLLPPSNHHYMRLALPFHLTYLAQGVLVEERASEPKRRPSKGPKGPEGPKAQRTLILVVRCCSLSVCLGPVAVTPALQ